MNELILASQSPRRRQLLEDAGFVFRTDTVKVSENIEENLNPRAAVEELSRRKAKTYVESHNYLKLKEIIVLSADTMVCLGNCLLGKPKNKQEAHEHLRRLSGKSHSVITAFSLYHFAVDQWETRSCETAIHFYDLSDEEIWQYIETGEPMDKAGSYAIQGEGRKFVRQIEGSWSNVVGLPMELLQDTLKELGWNVAKSTLD